MNCTWIPVATGLWCLAALSTGPSAQGPFVASGEANAIGASVSGTCAGTHAADDGALESITEAMTKGRPASRTHGLEHHWFFEVAAHTSATLRVRAARQGSESFTFSWSNDGGRTWQPAYALTHDALPRIPDSVTLPGCATGGTLWIRLEDDDRSAADDTPDTVIIDYLAVALGPDQPPATPTGLQALGVGPYRVAMRWDPGTGDADCYRIERYQGLWPAAPVAVLGPSTTSFVDDLGRTGGSRTRYRIIARNGVGPSVPSAWVSGPALGDGAFDVEFVDASPGARTITLAIDPYGKPGVLLGDDQGMLRLAEERWGDWSAVDVPIGGLDVSLAYDVSGAVAVAYVDAGVRFASPTAESTAQDKLVDRQGHGPIALVIEPRSGALFLAYVRDGHGRSALQEIWLARRSSNGKWSRQQVDRVSVTTALSLAIDPEGRPGLAYGVGNGSTEDALGYAHWDGADWDVEVVESGAASYGAGARLAYDPGTGEPAIVHAGGRLARRDGPTWSVAVLPDPARLDVGLAIDARGVAYVASVAAATGELTLWQWTGSGWSPPIGIDADVDGGVPGFLIHPRTQEALIAYRARQFDVWGLKVARKHLESASRLERHIAFPQEHLHSNSGESGPLGWSYPSVDEARTQHLVPARYLPPVPSEIVALEVAVSPNRSTTREYVNYTDLRISIGHGDESVWTDRFADNLPEPLRVFERRNRGIVYGGGWTRLTFDQPFGYDGRSPVVVDIQKAVDTLTNWRFEGAFAYHMLRWHPERRDLPPSLIARGEAGSGAADAVSGRRLPEGLMFRLVFRAAPTMTVDAPRGPRIPGVAERHSFCRGCPVTFAAQGRAGEAWLGFLGTQLLETPRVWPGIAGHSWLANGVPAFLGTIGADGVGRVQIAVPDSPDLVGLHIHSQSLVVGGAAAWTNLVDGILAE